VPAARYTGLIDDLQVYSHALSDADVQFIFDNPGSVVPEPACGTLCVGAAALLLAARRRRA
jgi:ribonucleotide monophosphatase NagD (HAD superfamily)